MQSELQFQSPAVTRNEFNPMDGPPPIKRKFRAGLSNNELRHVVRSLLSDFDACEQDHTANNNDDSRQTSTTYDIVK